jgi:hypothetical protein
MTFTDDEIIGSTACPACGSESCPKDALANIEVCMNWRELRFLVGLAEMFVEVIKDTDPDAQAFETLRRIVQKLEEQRPSFPKLSGTGETLPLH